MKLEKLIRELQRRNVKFGLSNVEVDLLKESVKIFNHYEKQVLQMHHTFYRKMQSLEDRLPNGEARKSLIEDRRDIVTAFEKLAMEINQSANHIKYQLKHLK